MAKKQRTDADRRLRQCERMARHLRVLQCIMGRARWDSKSLAEELQCHPKTIQRIFQTFTLMNVPWYFDQKDKAYRVQAGYRFPGLADDSAKQEEMPRADLARTLRSMAQQTEQLLIEIRKLMQVVDRHPGGSALRRGAAS